MMQPRIERRVPGTVDRLPENLHPVVRRVLAARGIRDAKDLDLSLAGLLRTDGLSGMGCAVALLRVALDRDQRICIVADFDADGATSCALAVRALRACGARHVDYVVPNRFEYGYGLTPPIVDLVAARGADLIVTVDNGISSLEGIAAAKAAGLRVLVTDHHLPGASLPAADAIVNPNLPGEGFASRALAGVGVIFYVMLALRAALRAENWFARRHLAEPNLGDLLDLVALGTVADVVPLDANNRRLVAQGLARIRAGRAQPGVQALLAVAKRSAQRLVAADLGFAIGPRLNAAGRLADMSLGIECLIEEDPQACLRMAQALDELNRARREIEQEMKAQALNALARLPAMRAGQLPAGLCLYDPAWHQGVIGVLASRLKDLHHRPVIAFAAAGDDEIKGSARSIPGVHIRDVLDAVAARHPEILRRFGGHAMAAGLSLRRTDLPAFERVFAAEVALRVEPHMLERVVLSDGPLAASDLSLDLARALAERGPWGQGFPEPLFDGRFIVQERRVVGETHVRLRLKPTDADAAAVPAIAFNAAAEPWALDAPAIQAGYRLAVNEYQGLESVQLVIEWAEPA